MCANVQLSRVNLVPTLDVTCDKMYQALSLISEEREPKNEESKHGTWIIGISLSERHASELNSRFFIYIHVYMYIYIYVYNI